MKLFSVGVLQTEPYLMRMESAEVAAAATPSADPDSAESLAAYNNQYEGYCVPDADSGRCADTPSTRATAPTWPHRSPNRSASATASCRSRTESTERWRSRASGTAWSANLFDTCVCCFFSRIAARLDVAHRYGCSAVCSSVGHDRTSCNNG